MLDAGLGTKEALLLIFFGSGVAGHELIYPASGIYKALLACEERVRLTGDL